MKRPPNNSSVPKTGVVSVVIADGSRLLRELIVKLVSRSFRRVQIAEVGTLGRAIPACAEIQPDLLLVSLALLAREGEESMNRLRAELPDLNVLAYAGPLVKQKHIVLAIGSGINGCVGADAGVHEFMTAIERVRGGHSYFCGQTARLLSEMACGLHAGGAVADALSRREIEVLKHIADGNTSKQIARMLGLSVATIDTHRRNLMVKIGAHNAADLIRYGHKYDMLDVPLAQKAGSRS